MEACSHTSINAGIRSYVYSHVYGQVLIYTAARTRATLSERNCPIFETAARGFEPGFSRLRLGVHVITHIMVFPVVHGDVYVEISSMQRKRSFKMCN